MSIVFTPFITKLSHKNIRGKVVFKKYLPYGGYLLLFTLHCQL